MRRTTARILVLLLVLTGVRSTAHGQCEVMDLLGPEMPGARFGITPTDDWAGRPIAVDNGWALIGASGESMVYLAQQQPDSLWQVVDTTSPMTTSEFGWSVAYNDTTGLVAVGDPSFNMRGRVSIYQRTGTSLSFIQHINGPGSMQDQRFGQDLDFSPDGMLLVVGAPRRLNQRGRAYIYETATYSQIKEIAASDTAPHKGFGQTVQFYESNATAELYVLVTQSPDQLTCVPCEEDAAHYTFRQNFGGANNYGEINKRSMAGTRYGSASATDGTFGVVADEQTEVSSFLEFSLLDIGIETLVIPPIMAGTNSGHAVGVASPFGAQYIVANTAPADDTEAPDAGIVRVLSTVGGMTVTDFTKPGGINLNLGLALAIDSDGIIMFAGFDAGMGDQGGGVTIFDLTGIDCDGNGLCDDAEIAAGIADDCWPTGTDCAPGGNGIPDMCDITSGMARDCDNNGIPDDCEICDDPSLDLNGNGVLDVCEVNYIGPAAGSWFNPANWENNAVPDASTIVVIGVPDVEIDNPFAVAQEVYLVGNGSLSITTVGVLTTELVVVVDSTAGILGEGTIVGDVICNGFFFIVTFFDGSFAIDGNLTLTRTAEVITDFDGPPGLPTIDVTGTATIEGGNSIEGPDGFVPSEGTTYALVSGVTVVARFDIAIVPNIEGLNYYQATTTSSTVEYIVDTLTTVLEFDPSSFTTLIDIPVDAVAADVDGVNGDDIVVLTSASVGSGSAIVLLLNDGTGTLVEQSPVVLTGTEPLAIAAGDIDNMNGIDVAVIDGTGLLQVAFNDGAGVFAADTAIALGGTPVDIAIDNLDVSTGDDVLVTVPDLDQIQLYVDYAGTSFTTITNIATGIGSAPAAMATVDIDNDFNPDILVVLEDLSELAVYGNMGGLVFDVDELIGVDDIPTDIEPTDVDEDKDIDAYLLSRDGMSIGLIENDDGDFSLPATATTPDPAGALTSGDFDNDGDRDLLLLAEDDFALGVAQVYRNDTNIGTQLTFASNVQSLGVGSDVRVIVTGMFDGDLLPDLAVFGAIASGGGGTGSPMLMFANASDVANTCAADCTPDNGDGTYGNGVVNIDDLLNVINTFGPAASGDPCDMAPATSAGGHGNGVVNIDDLLTVINNFGACP